MSEHSPPAGTGSATYRLGHVPAAAAAAVRTYLHLRLSRQRVHLGASREIRQHAEDESILGPGHGQHLDLVVLGQQPGFGGLR
jgi:hypothetical protein